jgi:hypothetical protein
VRQSDKLGDMSDPWEDEGFGGEDDWAGAESLEVDVEEEDETEDVELDDDNDDVDDL